jgi:hypothetical protein
MKNKANNFFPIISDMENINIKNECNSNGYRFVYDKNNKIARLEDRENNVHGNVRFFHGLLMIEKGNNMFSVFRYVKLGNILNPAINNLINKYKSNHNDKLTKMVPKTS